MTLRWIVSAGLPLGFLLLAGCPSDNDYNPFPTGDAARPDGLVDAARPDTAPLPDRLTNPEGPRIVILEPSTNEIVAGQQMEVRARITDEDSEVDPSSVKAFVTVDESFPLARQSSDSDVYVGIVSIDALPDGLHEVVVEAADLKGNVNSASVNFQRDLGPELSFYSPSEGERYAHSVNLSFRVSDADGIQVESVSAKVGFVELDIAPTDQDQNNDPPHWASFTYNIVFNDPMFSPPLQGTQMVTVQATNANGTTSTSSVTFVVDESGPEISLLQPQPGDIVGGILEIQAQVSDEAGVLETSVVAVIAGDTVSFTLPMEHTSGIFRTLFDTRVLPDTFVFPSISVRAADVLGNESQVGFLVALDNQPPKVSLDPPEEFFLASRDNEGQYECSQPFDPVGSDAADWGQTVPQIFYLRARVEDQGNYGPGLVQGRVSLVDYSTVKLYVHTDPDTPLVVDTDGDGYCDDINPNLLPSTNPQGANEVLALDMSPISPTGDADFRPYGGSLPVGCDKPGTGSDAPETLCPGTTMTVAIFYTWDETEPAIFALKPVDSQSPVYCTGQQFDARANSIPEGWMCVAVRAEDRLGNIGVSPPLPLCVDYTLDGDPHECASPPDDTVCLGTWDPQTMEASNTPCQWNPDRQLFRDREVRIKEQ